MGSAAATWTTLAAAACTRLRSTTQTLGVPGQDSRRLPFACGRGCSDRQTVGQWDRTPRARDGKAGEADRSNMASCDRAVRLVLQSQEPFYGVGLMGGLAARATRLSRTLSTIPPIASQAPGGSRPPRSSQEIHRIQPPRYALSCSGRRGAERASGHLDPRARLAVEGAVDEAAVAVFTSSTQEPENRIRPLRACPLVPSCALQSDQCPSGRDSNASYVGLICVGLDATPIPTYHHTMS